LAARRLALAPPAPEEDDPPKLKEWPTGAAATGGAAPAPNENADDGAPAAAVETKGIPPAAGAVDPKEKAALEFEGGAGCCTGCMVAAATGGAAPAPNENVDDGAPAAAEGATGIPPAAGAVDPKEKAALEFEDGMGCCMGCAVGAACVGWDGAPTEIGAGVEVAAEVVAPKEKVAPAADAGTVVPNENAALDDVDAASFDWPVNVVEAVVAAGCGPIPSAALSAAAGGIAAAGAPNENPGAVPAGAMVFLFSVPALDAAPKDIPSVPPPVAAPSLAPVDASCAPPKEILGAEVAPPPATSLPPLNEKEGKEGFSFVGVISLPNPFDFFGAGVAAPANLDGPGVLGGVMTCERAVVGGFLGGVLTTSFPLPLLMPTFLLSPNLPRFATLPCR